MTLLPPGVAPSEEVWVALDLETTGLSAERDGIIEVGAVKFRGDEILDTFNSLVNPRRRLDDFIVRLTGINQNEVDRAPEFGAVRRQFAEFVGQSPIVGHNLRFDLSFLASHGLALRNPRCDTWDLAYVLYPDLPEYSLERLADRFGVRNTNPHRALADAHATRNVFNVLLRRVMEFDALSLAEMGRLAGRSSWVLAYLLDGIEPGPALDAAAASGGVSAAGLDMDALGERLQQERPIRPNQAAERIDVDMVESLLRSGSPLAEAMDGFEERPEQIAVARAVAEAINEGQRLVVEAGTGVGKSVAYLLPALLYATANNRRVVVSTNTINLQEQLVEKDVPMLVEALEDVPGVDAADSRFCQLKGRANYLCLRRWSRMRSGDTLNEDEARLLSKTLVWLGETSTGDRSELNLGHRSAAAPWSRLSSERMHECLGLGGPCFLRAAREKAAASHVVVVNHALLLSDVLAEGSLLPEYDVLIVDEAHHLEEEATRRFGYDLSQAALQEHLQRIGGESGLPREAVDALRGSSVAASRMDAAEKAASDATDLSGRALGHAANLFTMLLELTLGQVASNDYRVTGADRGQPGWSDLEAVWENLDVTLSELGVGLRSVSAALDNLEEANVDDYAGLRGELSGVTMANEDFRRMLKEFVPNPQDSGVYWISKNLANSDLLLHMAPLDVSEQLEESLFSEKECVVLTSATLTTAGRFDHVRERLGLDDAEELLVGSPFDYESAVLLCVPEDMPEPNSWAYQEALEQAVSDVAVAANGRTMALFTSHASLRTTAHAIRGRLSTRGIGVLAQGLDGSPQQLVRRFLENPETVLLGTASFWEGVDLAGESLQALLVARLPFNVPTEPVFEARSEQFENAFMQYALPQAILRLRQGFGRLIRTKTDRGAAVILDSRLVSRRYGRLFVDSLPAATRKRVPLYNLGGAVKRWLGA